MTSIKTTARIAGFLYLLQIPLGVFGILYVPKVLMVLWLLIKGVNVEKFEKWNQESLKKQP
jgi:cyanate permease